MRKASRSGFGSEKKEEVPPGVILGKPVLSDSASSLPVLDVGSSERSFFDSLASIVESELESTPEPSDFGSGLADELLDPGPHSLPVGAHPRQPPVLQSYSSLPAQPQHRDSQPASPHKPQLQLAKSTPTVVPPGRALGGGGGLASLLASLETNIGLADSALGDILGIGNETAMLTEASV